MNENVLNLNKQKKELKFLDVFKQMHNEQTVFSKFCPVFC